MKFRRSWLACSLLLSAGCAQTRLTNGVTIESEIVEALGAQESMLVGNFDYPFPFWSTTFELRGDATFRYAQLTDTFGFTEYEGTWALVGDRVIMKSDALKDGKEIFMIVRQDSRIGLLSEATLRELRSDGRLQFAEWQTAWKTKSRTNHRSQRGAGAPRG